MSLNRSRHLRRNATEAEQNLWHLLRNRQIAHLKFRRQYPVGPFTVDFACFNKKLIVEADGGQHADNEADEKRTKFLEKEGWRVLRFWNHEILENPDGVLLRIVEFVGEDLG